ncbi:MAG: flagellar biosynthesis protein FlhF [Proteobacteria bacterium]|nr:flagellar biosynthesis protein FlhF [Pseudomonadota bacterium]MBU4471519.1 flagellar biosynthesis protein FlhF [Pseudomonadota bacterium]MCG2752525.1 flagellar biosynthesis protein FlhF [Desulfobacteraceae bacterium]
MQIKRFEAKSMAEAFKNIKQEFGPDAVILSAKTIHKEKGFFDKGKSSMVEVLAANDSYIIQQEKGMGYNKMIRQYSDHNDTHQEEEPVLKSELNHNSKKPSLLRSFRISKSRENLEEPNDLDELKEYKRLLLANGVRNEIASEIIDRTHRLNSAKDMDQRKGIKKYLPEILFDMGVRHSTDKRDLNKQNIVALIGLTGVGKTTTLAKLAAIQILEMNRSVGVISLDNFRVGSNALLKVFANIIGFPFECISNPKEIKAALKSFGDKDVILVDTPGIGLNDFQHKHQIKELIEKIRPDETHLLMHANVKQSDAIEIKQNFDFFNFNRILFTKIDETSTYGTMINQLLDTGKSISYITMGQNVPEDISAINLIELANLVIKQKDNHGSYGSEKSNIKSVKPYSMFQRAELN